MIAGTYKRVTITVTGRRDNVTKSGLGSDLDLGSYLEVAYPHPHFPWELQ